MSDTSDAAADLAQPDPATPVAVDPSAAPAPMAAAMDVMPAPAIVAAPVATPPAAAPTPVTAAVPAPIRVEPYQLPTATLDSLAQSAGLQWVQSDAGKISAVQAAMAAEPAPVRMQREPRRHAVVDDGPLVLVETKKDLSQMKLPFEQQAAR